MNKFGYKAAGIGAMLLGLFALAGCGPKFASTIAGTKWTSATILADAMALGATSSTFNVEFKASTTTDSVSRVTTGPWVGTLTIVYGPTAGSLAGCTLTETFTGGTYSETQNETDSNKGTFTTSGATSTATRTGCTDQTQNSTTLTNLHTNNAGSSTYEIMGTMMTVAGSTLLYECCSRTMTFTKMN